MNMRSAYQLFFKVRFDLPFPFYDDEKMTLAKSIPLVPDDASSTPSSDSPWLPSAAADNVRKENMLPTTFRRRAAVFDHHDVHPDWAGKDDSSPPSDPPSSAPSAPGEETQQEPQPQSPPQAPVATHGIQHTQSLRLPEGRKRLVSHSDSNADEQYSLDRAKSASAKVADKSPGSKGNSGSNTPRQIAAEPVVVPMSQVNKMRTDRLANALKALEKKSPIHTLDDSIGRSQSMRNRGGRRRPANPAAQSRLARPSNHESEFETSDRSDEDSDSRRPKGGGSGTDFRRRTSSVPPQIYEELRRRRRELPPTPTGGDQRSVSPRDRHHAHSNSTLSPTNDDPSYQRMRTFTIDPSKGHVINRGDSFRRRCHTGATGSAPTPSSPVGATGTAAGGSKNSSTLSSRSHSPFGLPSCFGTSSSERIVEAVASANASCPCSTSVRRYTVVVLGLEEVGKTSMINQFMTSEYCNPFQSDTGLPIDDPSEGDTAVTVILNGEESQLIFIEADNQKNDLSMSLSADGYIVMYSIDDGISFENARQVLFQLRLQTHSAQKPIILVGNKMDLERKRLVSIEEGKAAAKENDCKFVEIAVVLGHHVDELLVAMLAQVRRQGGREHAIVEARRSIDQLLYPQHRGASASPRGSSSESSDSTPHHNRGQHQHHRRQHPHGGGRGGSPPDTGPNHRHQPNKANSFRHVHDSKSTGYSTTDTTSCSNLTSVGHKIAEKVFGRRRNSRSLEDLLSVRRMK